MNDVNGARLRELEALLALTEEMGACAQRGDWEAVARMEDERALRLRVALEMPIPHGQAAAVERRLRKILNLSETFIAVATGVRDENANHLRRLRQGKRAYLDI